VNYTVSGTAVNGTDYQTVSGTATIAAGALGVDVAITPINDSLVEGTETTTLALAAGAYGRGPEATLYLTDNETPTVQVGFANAGAAVVENVGTTNIPVTLSASSASPVTVEYLVDTGSRASTTATGAAPAAPPYWVRCARVGNTVTGSISPDGVAWTPVSSQTVPMSSVSYQAGLFVCSYNTGTRCTAVFDNVSITSLSAGGSQGTRTATDVGAVAQAGTFGEVGGTYTIQGGGDNVDGTTDQGYFVYFPITNSADCTITARVVSESNTNDQATAGVMIREGTANNVRRGYMAQLPTGDSEFHYRTAAAATDVEVVMDGADVPIWLRLQRVGNILSAFQSNDGAAWTQVGSNLDLPLGSEVQAGLAVSSQAEGTVSTATIDNVTQTPGAFGNAVGRTVGFSAVQGSDAFAGGVYTIVASGDGVNGTTDDCYFVSAPLTGDFTLSARITGVQGTAS
jgi:regulation of enolase protein 1 (concanavalin A-like superfamily)